MLMHRIRFEQRFLEGVDDTSLRFRYFARLTYPLNGIHDNLSLAINEEVFIHLNDPDGGPHSGFNQNRLFIGLNYRVSKRFAFELGYQNQYVAGQVAQMMLLTILPLLACNQTFLLLSNKFIFTAGHDRSPR